MAFVAVAVLFWTQLQAQSTRTVTGKVTDEKGAVLSGVTVSAGSTRTTVTDNAGNFTLQISSDVKSIRFSSVGFNTLDLAVTSKSEYSVSLTSDEKALS